MAAWGSPPGPRAAGPAPGDRGESHRSKTQSSRRGCPPAPFGLHSLVQALLQPLEGAGARVGLGVQVP